LIDSVFVPQSGTNTSEFKFQYAIRGLYNRKIENDEKASDVLTAFTSMINTFNKYAHGHIKIDDALTRSIARSIIMSFDYVFNSEHIQRTLAGNYHLENVILDMYKESTDYNQYGLNIHDSVMIVESLTRSDAIHKVLSSTLKSDRKTNASMLYANIIDLNMVPFDIHVLARQLPFHFILNYAYTFDTIVANMMSLPGDTVTITDNDDKEISDARRAFMSLISKPMKNYNNDEKNWIYRVINGAVNLPYFGQPKFLSDQMMKKILTKDNSIGTNLSSYNMMYEVQLIDTYIMAPQSGITAEYDVNEATQADIDAFNVNFQNIITDKYDSIIINFINKVLKNINDKIDVRKYINTIYEIIMTIAKINPCVDPTFYPAEVIEAINKAIAIDPTDDKPKLSYAAAYDDNNIIWKLANKMYENFVINIKYKLIPYNYAPSNAIINAAVALNLVPAVAGIDSGRPIPIQPMKNGLSLNNIKLVAKNINNTDEYTDTSLGNLFDMTIIRSLIHIHLVFETVQMRLNSDLTYMNPNIHEQSVVTDKSVLSQSMYHFYGPEYARKPNRDNTSDPDRTI